MTSYKNDPHKPKTKPKHEINDKQGKHLKEQEKSDKRKIQSFYGGTNPND